jgi:hypothetical protein
MNSELRKIIEEKLRTGQYCEALIEERVDPPGWRLRSQVHADEAVRESRIRSLLPASDKQLVVALNPSTGVIGALEIFGEAPTIDFDKGGTSPAPAGTVATQLAEIHTRRVHAAHAWSSDAIDAIADGRIKFYEDLVKTIPPDVDTQIAQALVADASQPESISLRSKFGRITSGGKTLSITKLPSRKTYRIWVDVRGADKDARPNGTVTVKIDPTRITDTDTPPALRSSDRLKVALQTRDDSRSISVLLLAGSCNAQAELEVRLDYLLADGRTEIVVSKILNEASIAMAYTEALRDLFSTN